MDEWASAEAGGESLDREPLGQGSTNSAGPLPMGAAYTSLADAVQGLTRLEDALRQRHDRRAIFATAYLVITTELHRKVEAGTFKDSAWAAQYAVIFANLYREALVTFEAGQLAAVPKAWQISFTTSLQNRALLIQDLVLGINAHINYDLALALTAVGIDPQRPARYHDHLAVNQVLHVATDRLQDQVCSIYAPILKVLDAAGGRVDELLANFSVIKARESAWLAAVALVNARDAEEQAALRANLNDRAAVLSRLILSPNPLYPWLIGALRHLERRTPWWECVRSTA
jgi:hypothetical protein